ncbi:MAG: hypothetical protein AB9907_10380 [Flexilinea sp.]
MKKNSIIMILMICLLSGVWTAVSVSADNSTPRNPSISMDDLLLTLTPEVPAATPVVDSENQISDAAYSALISDLSVLIENIYGYTTEINDSICAGDDKEYPEEMSELAASIVQANTILDQVDLPYSFNLWSIYNIIKADPTCGIGDEASLAADTARQTYHKAAQFVNYEDETILCPCYDIATDSWLNSGHYYAGACKCVNY